MQKRGQFLQDNLKDSKPNSKFQNLVGSFDGKGLAQWACEKEGINSSSAREDQLKLNYQLDSCNKLINTNKEKCLTTWRTIK
jgi:hypothetical protein